MLIFHLFLLLQEVFVVIIDVVVHNLIAVRAFEEVPREHIHGNSLLETVWDKFTELVQLFLLVLRMLGFLNESNDLFLDVVWQIKMIHSSVYCINFLLQNNGLLIDVVN